MRQPLFRERIVHGNVPGARRGCAAKRWKRIRRGVIGMPVVNPHVQVRDTGSPSATTAASAAATAEATAPSTLPALWGGAERVDEPHVDVIELTRRCRHRVKV